MKHYLFLATALVLLLVLPSGCDLLTGEEDIVIEASGQVVLAGTGEPIEGLSAVIVEIPSPIGATLVVASTQTDAEGRFSLHYRKATSSGAVPLVAYAVEVNTRPYDSHYTTFSRPAHPGNAYYFGVIELEENDPP